MNRAGRFALPVVALAVLVASPAIHAQDGAVGAIRGVVYDADFDVPLARVRVAVIETGATIETSRAGEFVFENVPPGEYTLTFLKEGYEREVRSGVVVTAGRLADLRVDLASEVIEMEELVVTGEDFLAGTELALLDIRQTSLNLQDAISSELISKAGASDVSGALGLVTGASVVDGKYATVRGLSDRYTGTTLNGVRLPSADPRRRAVQIDLFPTGTVESITVTKTFTPDLQGDFTGGGVDIKTKGVPDGLILSMGISSEWDSLATGEDAFLTYDGGGVPRDAKADDRALPDAARVENLPEGSLPTTPTISNRIDPVKLETSRQYDALTRSFDPVFGVSQEAPGTNSSLSLTVGDRIRPGAGDLAIGLLGALTWRRGNSYYGGGENNNATVNLPGEPLALDRPRTENRGVQEVLLGGLGTVVVQPNENHEVALRAVVNRSAEDEARFQVEDRGSTDTIISVDQNQALRYTERSLTSYQLHGSHRIPEIVPGPFSDLVVDWTASDNSTRQDEPDQRFFRNSFDFNLDTGLGSASDPGDGATQADIFRRIYRTIEEDGQQYALDVELPFVQWTDAEGSIKLGWFDDASDRTSDQLSFTYEFQRQLGRPGSAWDVNRTLGRFVTDDPAALWSDVFLEPRRVGLSPERCIEGQFWARDGCVPFDQLLWSARPIGADVSYVASQGIEAWYAMANVPLVPRVELLFGARQESTRIDIAPFNPIDPERDLERIEVSVIEDPATGRVTINRSVVGTPPDQLATSIDEAETLPVAGLTWKILEGMNLRASWSRTIARPTFRELAPVATIEFLAGDEFVGNPDLAISSITNYDLRWEWFPRAGDLVAFSVFHKAIEDPIERINFQAGGRFFVQPINYDTGKLDGFEIEGRTALDRIGDWARHLSVGANYTRIDSEVEVPAVERDALADFGLDTETRRLQGQPEDIANVNVGYDNPETGTSASVFYNRIGTTLISGAAKGEFGGIPDVLEQPYETVNVTFSQRIARGFSIGLKAKNLTEPERLRLYETPQGQTEVKTRVPTALRVSVGLKWEW